MDDYVAILRNREIPPAQVEYYKIRLRYFYDFYAKYPDMDDKLERTKLFLEKLRSKNQTPVLRFKSALCGWQEEMERS